MGELAALRARDTGWGVMSFMRTHVVLCAVYATKVVMVTTWTLCMIIIILLFVIHYTSLNLMPLYSVLCTTMQIPQHLVLYTMEGSQGPLKSNLKWIGEYRRD